MKYPTQTRCDFFPHCSSQPPWPDRYLLSSVMLDQLKTEEDGSLVLRIGKDSPGQDLESNWLPAPDGPFYMVMRLYGPEKAALEGEWSPPKAKKAN